MDGLRVSRSVTKAAVQCARARLMDEDWPDIELLALQVSRDLRGLRVILVAAMVSAVMLALRGSD